LIGAVGPYPGKAISLQLNPDRQAIYSYVITALLRLGLECLNSAFNAKQVLDVVTDFVSNDVGLREVAGAPCTLP
jgi:hypothetical protein